MTRSFATSIFSFKLRTHKHPQSWLKTSFSNTEKNIFFWLFRWECENGWSRNTEPQGRCGELSCLLLLLLPGRWENVRSNCSHTINYHCCLPTFHYSGIGKSCVGVMDIIHISILSMPTATFFSYAFVLHICFLQRILTLTCACS